MVKFLEITCIEHGTFRSGIESEMESYPCVVCRNDCRAVIVGEGVTRLTEIPWELIAPPLSAWTRRLIMAESVLDENRPIRKARTGLKRGWTLQQKLRAVWR